MSYAIIGSIAGVLLCSLTVTASAIVAIVCIKKKIRKNRKLMVMKESDASTTNTLEKKNLDNIHMQDNEAYVLRSANEIQNTAYAVTELASNKRDGSRGHTLSESWQPREDDSIKDGGSHPIHEDTSLQSEFAYDYVAVRM